MREGQEAQRMNTMARRLDRRGPDVCCGVASLCGDGSGKLHVVRVLLGREGGQLHDVRVLLAGRRGTRPLKKTVFGTEPLYPTIDTQASPS